MRALGCRARRPQGETPGRYTEGRIYEPTGVDNELRPTARRVSFTNEEERSTKQKMITSSPWKLVGQTVRKWFDRSKHGPAGIYEGQVVDWDKHKGRGANQHLWRIQYPDGHAEDFDNQDMMRYWRTSDEEIMARRAVTGNQPEPEMEPEPEPDYESHSDDFGDESQGNVTGHYVTRANDTWEDIADAVGLQSLDEEERYFCWLKEEHNMGNKTRFKREKNCYYFPNPVKRRRYPAWHKGQAVWKFPGHTTKTT